MKHKINSIFGGNIMKTSIKKLAESAMLIAIAVVLSLFEFKGPWALGGGITICSMLPIVLIANRYGTGWGIVCSLVYSLLQLVLGFSNVQFAPTAISAAVIVLFDYILAYGVIGLAAVFNGAINNRRKSIVVGIIFTFSLRFLCHFISGLVVWEVILPNELGWAPAVWSLAYNGSYMLPEIIITCAAAMLLYKPLEKYWLGANVK
jgi:thiamine transporter